MRITKKLAIGAIGLALSLIGAGSGTYATNIGGCPSIKNYGNHNMRYPIAIVYEGGPVDTPLRMQGAVELYRNGIFQSIVITGFPEGMNIMKKIAEENGIPYKLTPSTTKSTSQVSEAFKVI